MSRGQDKQDDLPNIIGIYAQFAGIDYLEASALLDHVEKQTRPKNIEIASLFATLED